MWSRRRPTSRRRRGSLRTTPAFPRRWPWPAAHPRPRPGGRSRSPRPCPPPPPPRPPPPPAPRAPPAAGPPPAARPLEEAQVFAGLEGADEGLLLVDGRGRVLGGALRDAAARPVTDAVAAYLAGVSHEATRTAKLLALGTWTGLAAEGARGHVYLAPPTDDTLLLVVRDRAVPMGRLAIVAQRAAAAARRWLERER